MSCTSADASRLDQPNTLSTMDSKRQKTAHIFEAPAYLSGAPVLLKGLQSRPELNGTEAIYEKQHMSPDTGNVRYDVKLSDGTVIRVKESCVDRAEFQCDFFQGEVLKLSRISVFSERRPSSRRCSAALRGREAPSAYRPELHPRAA